MLLWFVQGHLCVDVLDSQCLWDPECQPSCSKRQSRNKSQGQQENLWPDCHYNLFQCCRNLNFFLKLKIELHSPWVFQRKHSPQAIPFPPQFSFSKFFQYRSRSLWEQNTLVWVLLHSGFSNKTQKTFKRGMVAFCLPCLSPVQIGADQIQW